MLLMRYDGIGNTRRSRRTRHDEFSSEVGVIRRFCGPAAVFSISCVEFGVLEYLSHYNQIHPVANPVELHFSDQTLCRLCQIYCLKSCIFLFHDLLLCFKCQQMV